MDRFHDIGLLLLRLVAGFYLAFGHGWPKISGSVGGGDWMAAAEAVVPGLPALLLALALVALELFGGLLIALGFFTRPVSATLILYVVGVHLFDLGIGELELAVLYGSVFLTLLFTGPGRYSVDGYLKIPDTPAYVVVNSPEDPAETTGSSDVGVSRR